jgi:prophage regulatory protein
MAERLIAWEELEPRVPYSRAHVHRLEAAGKFPRRVKVIEGSGAGGRVAWYESEIEDWFASRERKRAPRESVVPESTAGTPRLCRSCGEKWSHPPVPGRPPERCPKCRRGKS